MLVDLLDALYRRGAEGASQFVEALAPTDEALRAVSQRFITRFEIAHQPRGWSTYMPSMVEGRTRPVLARGGNRRLVIVAAMR